MNQALVGETVEDRIGETVQPSQADTEQDFQYWMSKRADGQGVPKSDRDRVDQSLDMEGAGDRCLNPCHNSSHRSFGGRARWVTSCVPSRHWCFGFDSRQALLKVTGMVQFRL